MKRFLFLILLTTISYCTHAQEFKQAAGIRLGWTPGFEYRIFADDYHSYRFLLSTRDRGLQAHVLKEFHQYDMFNFSDQLVFIYGAGLHAGYERWDVLHYNNNSQWQTTKTAVVAGVDGLVGVEYLFYNAPVSIGLDAKPYFEFFGKEFFNIQLFDIGFTVKYLF